MSCEERYSKLLELVERSESRIDRTNAMIEKLTACISNVSVMYDEHWKDIEHSRNIVLEQNSKLIKIVEDEQSKAKDVLRMHERLVNMLITHVGNSNTNTMHLNTNQ